MTLRMNISSEAWPMREAFRTARGLITEIALLVVTLNDDQGRIGRGEAVGVPYDGETVATMTAQLDTIAPRLATEGLNIDPLQCLPAGGARNALDCALWDLKAKRAGERVWRLAGLPEVAPVTTALTLSIASDDDHRRHVREARHLPILKLKVDRVRHLDLVRIAREEHPAARLLVDANQSWDRPLLEALAPALADLGVELIEQPVARGADESLRGYRGPVALAADESCTDRGSLNRLEGLYKFVSIKLEKTGGLAEALAVAQRAADMGFGLMVGNMGGTSLSMASHFVIAQRCAYVDLDAPLIIRGDRRHAMRYEGAVLSPPDARLWG